MDLIFRSLRRSSRSFSRHCVSFSALYIPIGDARSSLMTVSGESATIGEKNDRAVRRRVSAMRVWCSAPDHHWRSPHDLRLRQQWCATTRNAVSHAISAFNRGCGCIRQTALLRDFGDGSIASLRYRALQPVHHDPSGFDIVSEFAAEAPTRRGLKQWLLEEQAACWRGEAGQSSAITLPSFQTGVRRCRPELPPSVCR